MRRLLSKYGYGAEVEELDSAIDLIIHTKSPGKWRLIDMETGQEYIGLASPSEYGSWIRVKNKVNE